MLTKRFFKTKDEAEVTFEHAFPDASSVALVGDFTDWQPVEMKFSKKEGVYKVKQRLPVDQQFSYKYLLDGELWQNDHAADAYVPNGLGGDNSLVNTARCD
ncbi:isoamylase early set domain-containing protein [Pseudoalteromonas fenneropenaei]|uniref:Isoamylase early set domain-containing protein n=1 Tax=Pseudoalteromonas fenneropenaei TaxID=1737459 RepID=A0ABV7CMC4_9GAMM